MDKKQPESFSQSWILSSFEKKQKAPLQHLYGSILQSNPSSPVCMRLSKKTLLQIFYASSGNSAIIVKPITIRRIALF